MYGAGSKGEMFKFGKTSDMKKILLLAIAFTGITTFASAQAKKAAETVTIQTPTVQCQECKEKIETYLKREDGVIKSNVDYKKHIAKVTYYTDRTNPENIKAAIANAGYDADDIPANPDAYKLLPKTCKKFEDGGGHPKPKVAAVPVAP